MSDNGRIFGARALRYVSIASKSINRPPIQPLAFFPNAGALRYDRWFTTCRAAAAVPPSPRSWSPKLYLRRTSVLAISLIVVLRVAIGWQLLYEGLWKIKTLNTPTPWTSVGYLKNSQGPLRGVFRAMTGDPDELNWLDVDKMSAKWKDWQARFSDHYQLTDRQKSRLHSIVSGPAAFYSDVDALPSIPEGVNLDDPKLAMISYDAERKRLVVDGKNHMTAADYARVLQMLPESDTSELANLFREQLDKVYQRASRLSYIEQMRATISGDPDVAGVKNKKGVTQQMGELEKYRHMLSDYEIALANAKQDYQHDHLKKMWSDVQEQRTKLVGPVKALESGMKEAAEELLTVEQLRRGKLGEPWSMVRVSDTLTIAGLTVLGICLIAGLFTRFSAVMAAVMLFSFYLAMPPLPGLPPPPGPDHSLFVNKNLIEVFALLAIAALPSGYWFGLDAFVGKMLGRNRSVDK